MISPPPVVAAPPNAPMSIRSGKGQSLICSYDGKQLAEGKWTGKGIVRTMSAGKSDGPINQVWAVTAEGGPASLELRVRASGESFPCQADRTGYGALPIVRHVFGLGTNRLDRGVYDRQRDWVLSIDPGSAQVEVLPHEEADGTRTYALRATGDEIILRFRPRYYQKHRGLRFFEPWTYQVWKKPVVGWCSWFAYLTNVDQQKMQDSIDVLSEKLEPFGLQYIQIDDGYQRTPVGGPESWLQANSKFPEGLTGLVRAIHEKGLEAGVWSAPMVQDDAWAQAHADLFVKNPQGGIASGRWVGHPIDGSNPAVHERYLEPLYGGLAKMGWDYFKVDSLRHLRYEGYNSFTGYFAKKGVDRVEAYRSVGRTIRKEIGNAFFLACWGIRPELIGLADGCRIGDDGFAFAGLSQFNSWNNVVWRNDPDHIVLSREEGYRSCMTTSLTGSLFMVTDNADWYRTADLESAKRSIPVLFTRPGQIFDVDPSRSDEIGRVDSEVSGSGPRPFDASRLSTTGLFQLDLHLPYESWTVLGRTDEKNSRIPLADLGLDPKAQYLAYEFWTDRYLGEIDRELAPGGIDPKYGCQLFCIRRKLDRPQLVATRRHISCGALDVKSLSWSGGRLSGVSTLVKGDPYRIILTEPTGYAAPSVSAVGAQVVSDTLRPDGLREIVLSGSGEATWTAQYKAG